MEFKLVLSSVEGSLEYFEVEVLDPLNKTNVQKQDKSFTVSRPFLNPKRAYKEEVLQLNIFSNTAVAYFIIGGGKGWYSKFEERSRSEQDSLRYLKRSGLAFAILFTAYTGLELFASFTGDTRLSAEILLRIEVVMVALLAIILGFAFIKVKGLGD
ncbi:MAG TPA: hypothetical protein VGJ48_25585 [Pyrinomonadaceae bacterium]|jgi:hypothetical protein